MNNRRHFLRSAGVCLALPALDSLGHRAWSTVKPVAPIRRLAFLYVPNGVNVEKWNVQGAGADYTLSPTLEPLAGSRADFTVISNLRHEAATWGEDGPGDHARATAAFLTGCRPRKTAGPDIRLGVSVDQIAAQQIGHQTRLPSMELSTDDPRSSGKCDSGYSCAYQYNLSWKTPTQPVAAEQNPRAVFERLFGTTSSHRRSVIDFVLDDANDLKRGLGAEDRGRLDQYLEGVRAVERRLEPDPAAASPGARPAPPMPEGIPATYEGHIRAMFDLIALAFQTDTTRIATFMLAHDGSNHAFPEIGVPEAHHQISHHRDDPEKLAKIAKIDRFYITQLAWFLDRLRSIPDGPEGSLLERSQIVYGGCIKEGNKHSHEDLPVILAGRGHDALKPGRHLVAPEGTPMTNLYLSLVRRLGVVIDRVGDSTGELANL